MIALTLDIDWAPDFAIDYTAKILVAVGARATWFVTHESPAIDRLRAQGELFELGIHPNFLPGSTHGGSEKEVLEHCLRIVPGARSMRTHGLVQSTRILRLAVETGSIETDVSLFLPRAAGHSPVPYRTRGRSIVRVPFNWEDDYEMDQPDPRWRPEMAVAGDGLNVFDFHPIHVYLNACDMGPYRALIDKAPSLPDAAPEDADALRRSGEGPESLFRALVERLSGEGGGVTVSEISKRALEEAWS